MFGKRNAAMVIGLVILVMLSPMVRPEGAVRAEHGGQGGAIFYESQPDEVALYLSDVAYVRDAVVLPVAQETRILLPPGTYANTLRLSEDGERVQTYRLAPVSNEAFSSYMGRPNTGSTALVLTWEASELAGDRDTRQVSLEYLLPGAQWTPNYDMDIVDDETVTIAFFAQIQNSVLDLASARVFLVAGRVDLSGQVDQVSQITMNQYAVGYSNEMVSLPALGAGSVDLQHVYALDDIVAQPGETLFVNLVNKTMSARRVVVWNASQDQETDVIFKVKNDADVPLAEGMVRTYQNDLFVGSDFIETTPVGSEGSVTVGSLPDVRVRRAASEEYVGADRDDYYLHRITLEVNNHSLDDIDLVILDRWPEQAWQFEYSLVPERDQDNLLRWEVQVKTSETLTITYSYRTEY